jgi:salicylate hydroxylase
MPPMDSTVLIVGGGIAGLAASLGLARIGQASHVLERAHSFEDVGAGIQISPNAVRALQWLGAWDAVAPFCFAPRNIVIRDGRSGKTLQRIELGASFEARFGAPYRVALRADLLKGLLEAARAQKLITLQNDAQVTGISSAETTLTLQASGTLTAKAIIGADGVNSIVRRHLQSAGQPLLLDHMLYRKLLPAVGDQGNVTLWLCAGGHAVHYPVGDGRMLNLVASVEAHNGADTPQLEDACQELGDLLQGTWSKWPALSATGNPAWHHHNTVLVGDAAHASLPYLAQGAAMALEDACVLAQQVQGNPDYAAAFAKFAGLRLPRTSRLQSQSRRNGRIYHATGLFRTARNRALTFIDGDFFLKQLSWIYDWTP